MFANEKKGMQTLLLSNVLQSNVPRCFSRSLIFNWGSCGVVPQEAQIFYFQFLIGYWSLLLNSFKQCYYILWIVGQVYVTNNNDKSKNTNIDYFNTKINYNFYDWMIMMIITFNKLVMIMMKWWQWYLNENEEMYNLYNFIELSK